jgi:hypothetical protein
MAADSLEELHKMADAVGLERRWFQDGHLPHYDLCQSKKRLAIKQGAVRISTKDLIAVIRKMEDRYG